MRAAQEVYKSVDALFGTLTDKHRPKPNKTILLLQYCKLSRNNDDRIEDWIGRLKVVAADCKYKETDGHLKEKNINDLMMMA